MEYSLSNWVNADWSAGIPLLQTFSEDIKQKWTSLPLDEKISTILLYYENTQAGDAARDSIVKKCWQKSKECSSGEKILAIRQRCMEISPVVKEEHSDKVKITCDDGEVEIPHFYKRALAKDSDFFGGLFYSPFFKEKTEQQYKVLNIPKAEIERVIEIWSGQPLRDIDEAYDLLETINDLSLPLPAIEETLCAAIRTWSKYNESDMSMAASLAKQISNFSIVDKLHDVLEDFLLNAYVTTHGFDEKLTENILSALRELPIKSLNFDKLKIRDLALQQIISACPNLNSISLQNSLIPIDKSTEYLANLPNLESLDLSGCLKEGASLKEFKNLTSLTKLRLGWCRQVTDEALKELKVLKNLMSLSLVGCKGLTDAGLKELKDLKNLTSLDLSECTQFTEAGLKEIKEMTQLTGLILNDREDLTNASLTEIKELHNLTSLEIRGSKRITDTGIGELKELTGMTNLSLSGTSITDDGLKKLKNMTHLKSLALGGCVMLTDLGLSTLKNKTHLTTLNLCYCENITDEGLKELSCLPLLTGVHLTGCWKVTDAGIKELKKLTNLTYLDLSECTQLTDASLKELKEFPNLKRLELIRCKGLSADSIQELARARPGLKIIT